MAIGLSQTPRETGVDALAQGVQPFLISAIRRTNAQRCHRREDRPRVKIKDVEGHLLVGIGTDDVSCWVCVILTEV